MTDKAGNWGVEALRLRLDDPPSLALQPKQTTNEFVVIRLKLIAMDISSLQASITDMVESQPSRVELLRRLGDIKAIVERLQLDVMDAR